MTERKRKLKGLKYFFIDLKWLCNTSRPSLEKLDLPVVRTFLNLYKIAVFGYRLGEDGSAAEPYSRLCCLAFRSLVPRGFDLTKQPTEDQPEIPPSTIRFLGPGHIAYVEVVVRYSREFHRYDFLGSADGNFVPSPNFHFLSAAWNYACLQRS